MTPKASFCFRSGVTKMKLNAPAFANAAATWMAVVYLFCRFAIAIIPGPSLAVTRSWFHGFDMGKLWTPRVISEGFILGLVTAVVLTWVAGWLFAWLYNTWLRKK